MTAAFLPPFKFLLSVGSSGKMRFDVITAYLQLSCNTAVWPVTIQNGFLKKLNYLGSRLDCGTGFYMHRETQHTTRYGPTEATSGIQTHDPIDKTAEHIIVSPSYITL
jgi:hypothetical protein